MRASFPEALRVCLLEEGGNDDDPNDHGGRTSRGITQREWDAWRASHAGLPPDVWRAPQSEIEAIYQAQYWEPYCDALPAGLDLAFFDYAVNAGRTQAVRDLQRALGVEVDGMLGIGTKAAIAAEHDDLWLIHEYCDRRRAFYRHLAQFSRYGKGWLARVDHVDAAAKKLAGLSITDVEQHDAAAKRVRDVADRPDVTASPKADPADVKQPPAPPEVAVPATGAAGGLAAMLQQLHDQLAPYAGDVKTIQQMLIGIALVGFLASLYGLWHRARMASHV